METKPPVDLQRQLEESLKLAGYDPERVRLAIGEQWVASVVSRVVEELVNRPKVFQSIVDGILNRIKERL